jgi:multisubunit Na+/H+ antiporter MnhG subunit
MKIVLYIIGILISLFASIKILQIIFSDTKLSEYSKGYILGNVVLILIGLLLIFLAWKKRKASVSR